MDGIRRAPRVPAQTAKTPQSRPREIPQRKNVTPQADMRDLARCLSPYHARKKSKRGAFFKKTLFYLVFCVLICALCYGAFLSFKVRQASRSAFSLEKQQPTLLEEARSLVSALDPSAAKLRGQEQGRINILLLGAAGQGKPGTNLTDTVMVASLNLKEKKVALISLPRDLYVRIPGTNRSAKINTLYQYGISSGANMETPLEAVSEITGLALHYYLVLDFEGFEKVIDALGGINVMVERDIYDTRYPGPNYSYETFALSKGLHKLDGATALKYVRERHSDPEGDFGRAKRQQQVLQAIKSKVLSAPVILNASAMGDLLDTLGSHMRTNMGINEMLGIAALSRELDTQNISTAVVDAWKRESLLRVSHVDLGEVRAFILIPRSGNWNEVRDLSSNIFDREQMLRRAAAIAKEEPRVIILHSAIESAPALRIKDLLRQKLGENSTVALLKKDSAIPEKTRVLELGENSKIYSADEIVRTLDASLEKDEGISLPDWDFAIIVGKETDDSLSFEEDAMEDLAREEKPSEE